MNYARRKRSAVEELKYLEIERKIFGMNEKRLEKETNFSGNKETFIHRKPRF